MPTFASPSHQIVSLTVLDHGIEALFYSLPGDAGRRMQVFDATTAPLAPDRLLASHGLRLAEQWKCHPFEDPFTAVGHVAIVEPVPYGPELLTRLSDHQEAFAALRDAYAAHGVPGRTRAAAADAELAAAGFWDWFAAAVRGHQWWPWQTVDGEAIARCAAEAAYLHPDEDFRRDSYNRMSSAFHAGQADGRQWGKIGAISFDFDLETDYRL